jgi:hypothetical protein
MGTKATLKQIVKEAEKEAEKEGKMRGETKGGLWEGLAKASEEVDYYEQKIKEEERRTQKYRVRVIVETEVEKDFWRSITLADLDLTLEQRERVIAWLRKVY